MSDTLSRVSIIIPNFNHTRFLSQSVDSALAQTCPAMEIIVVDDGSTDNCREVVARYGESIRYIWQENQGLAGARNTGIRAARGELIGLLDADDQWMPDYLERMLTLVSNYPDAVAYYCQARCMDENGHDLPRLLGGPPIHPNDIYWQVLRANFIIPSTVILRRVPVIEAGLFDPNLRSCEDWDLWLRLLPKSQIVGTDEVLVRYRLHGSSLSTNVQYMQHAQRSTIEKNFGLDDDQVSDWSAEKSRAFGGVYRYYLLTSIQRQNDWNIAVEHLHKALTRDPSLAEDLELFYDLAMGSQPVGLRGSSMELDLQHNAQKLIELLDRLFTLKEYPTTTCLKAKTYGTAYFALGLLAYNTGKHARSREYFLKAMNNRPDLWRNKLVTLNLIKSCLPETTTRSLKRFVGR